jgi:hypothetical protein
MRTALACVMLLAAGAAAAQTLYRCGPDGRDFSQAPCPGGKQVEVQVRRPSSADHGAAREAALGDARLADRLAQERHAREALPVLPAAGFYPAPTPAEAPAPATKKKKKPKKKEKPASAELS